MTPILRPKEVRAHAYCQAAIYHREFLTILSPPSQRKDFPALKDAARTGQPVKDANGWTVNKVSNSARNDHARPRPRRNGSSYGYGRSRKCYADVMRRLIAYSRSSAFVLTFSVSIIRYL